MLTSPSIFVVKGYCHKDCISIAVKEDLEFVFLCKLCDAKLAPPISGRKDTLSTQVTLKGSNQEFSLHGQIQNETGFKCTLPSRYHNPAQPVVKAEISSPTTTSGSGSKPAPIIRRGRQNFSYGLIWKRKKGDDSGQDFRINNILLKAKEDTHPKANITCSLCNKPYRSDLMYIRCGSCLSKYEFELLSDFLPQYKKFELCTFMFSYSLFFAEWYHADALQLEEAQIFDLIGFKCCQCRRKASPKCPYADSSYKRGNRHAQMLVTAERNEGILPETLRLGHLTSSLTNSSTDNFATMDDDPLLYSFGNVELIGEQLDAKDQLGGQILPAKSQQKLSVRRPMVKHEKSAYEVCAAQNVNLTFAEPRESFHCVLANRQPVEWEAVADPGLTSAPKKLPSAQVEWDGSTGGGFGDEAPQTVELVDQLNDSEIGMGDDMEYEPQTYFSFHELLASDDPVATQYDMPMDDPGEWPFISTEATHQNVLPCSTSGGAYDMGSVNEVGASKVPVFDAEPCNLCKRNEPSPDLVCEICKMCIHSHCSPWEDCEGTQWRCGGCRVWR